jgi:hypothetical protein
MGQTTPSLRKSPLRTYHPLEVCIRENMYTWEVCTGLGWVAAASESVIGPELY